MKIFIPGNVPSSKSNQRWTGKYLIWSKNTMQYVKDSNIHYVLHQKSFVNLTKDTKPVKVHLTFFRKSRHRFDYINATQIVADLMVKHKWMDDDNADCFVPIYKPYVYDKVNPGVLIEIEAVNEYLEVK